MQVKVISRIKRNGTFHEIDDILELDQSEIDSLGNSVEAVKEQKSKSSAKRVKVQKKAPVSEDGEASAQEGTSARNLKSTVISTGKRFFSGGSK